MPYTLPERLVFLLSLCIAMMLVAGDVAAQEYGLIDDVQFATDPSGGTRIQIDFLQPVQYTGHSPQSSGTRLFIDIRKQRSGAPMQIPEQHRRPDGDSRGPLQEVIYRESDSTSASIELVFSMDTRFEILTEGDSRRLVIATVDSDTAVKALIESSETGAVINIAGDATELMDKARSALLSERDYPHAIALYESVLAQGNTQYAPKALEYLGIAQERMGEREDAVSTYSRYIQTYPEPTEDAERVRQRLLSVETALAMAPQRRLGAGSRKKTDTENGWLFAGSFYQYYLHDEFTVDGGGTETTGSAVNSDVDFFARRRGAQSNTEVRVNAGYYYDLLDERNSTSTRVNTFYVEHGDAAQTWWVRGGRQTGRRDGVLGRFDGLKGSYALSDTVALTAVAGAPVDSPRDAPDAERFFAGTALQIDSIFDALDVSLYAIEQRTDGLVDRRAVGTELRYFSPGISAFAVIDYDMFYSELNIGMLTLNWSPRTGTSFNLSADSRLLPLLTTQNSLQGQFTDEFQPVDGIGGMLDTYTDDEIYQFARDRTVSSQSVTLGGSQALSEKLRLSADLTSSSIDGTVTSGGVESLPATGDQYFGSIMLAGADLFGANDFTTLGLRWSETSTVNSSGVFVMGRIDLFEYWQIYARLAFDQRSWATAERDEQRVTPRIRIQYRRGDMQLEAELGARWSNIEYPDETESTLGLYGSLGYRYDF